MLMYRCLVYRDNVTVKPQNLEKLRGLSLCVKWLSDTPPHRCLFIHEVGTMSLADGLPILLVSLLLLLHLTHNVLAIDERLKPTHWIKIRKESPSP